MSHVLIVDNYDSFTYNLVQAVNGLGAKVTVKRNDAAAIDELIDLNPSHVIVSPGPGRPEQAGISIATIEAFMTKTPLLGVCLGHQSIVLALGGIVGPAQTLIHGKASQVYHDNHTLYEGLPNPCLAGRYHSLAASEHDLPDDLAISAYTSDGEIMGIRHKSLPTEGVQFHPESILTPEGDRLLRNFLDLESPQ